MHLRLEDAQRYEEEAVELLLEELEFGWGQFDFELLLQSHDDNVHLELSLLGLERDCVQIQLRKDDQREDLVVNKVALGLELHILHRRLGICRRLLDVAVGNLLQCQM